MTKAVVGQHSGECLRDKRHIFALYKLLNNAFLDNKSLLKRLYSSVGDHRVVLDTSQASVTRGSGTMIAAVYHPLL